MQNLHLALPLPVTIFKEQYTVHSFPLSRRILLSPAMHINPDIIDIISDAGFYINLTELFYSPPGMISGIHSDLRGDDISKINWVIGGAESVFNWYKPASINPIQGSNQYRAYTLDEVTLLDSTPLQTPSLIQAAIPHNVVNLSEPRWSVSLMIYNKKTYDHAAFNDVAAKLKDLNF